MFNNYFGRLTTITLAVFFLSLSQVVMACNCHVAVQFSQKDGKVKPFSLGLSKVIEGIKVSIRYSDVKIKKHSYVTHQYFTNIGSTDIGKKKIEKTDDSKKKYEVALFLNESLVCRDEYHGPQQQVEYILDAGRLKNGENVIRSELLLPSGKLMKKKISFFWDATPKSNVN